MDTLEIPAQMKKLVMDQQMDTPTILMQMKKLVMDQQMDTRGMFV